MENTNTVSIPLVDVLSTMLGKRIVMSGEDYVEFETLVKISKSNIDLAVIEKEKVEKSLKIPTSISMRQGKLHLLSLGLLDSVEAIISTNRSWQIEWEYSSEVLRTSPLIEILKVNLELTDEQVDDIFIAASKL
jgi:hypothetical protein